MYAVSAFEECYNILMVKYDPSSYLLFIYCFIQCLGNRLFSLCMEKYNVAMMLSLKERIHTYIGVIFIVTVACHFN